MRSVYAIAASILGNQEDADDCVQETFLRVLERIRTFNPRRPFAPWLYQVARNVARNRWKALKRRRSEDLTALARAQSDVHVPDPEALLERSEMQHLVGEAIEQLPERQRAAFRLHDIEGFRAAEIATMLGIRDGTVRANLHHARRALRGKLEPFVTEWTEP
jgi:RNA polymerase sigma-70 factor (ECF subfamily)